MERRQRARIAGLSEPEHCCPAYSNRLVASKVNQRRHTDVVLHRSQRSHCGLAEALLARLSIDVRAVAARECNQSRNYSRVTEQAEPVNGLATCVGRARFVACERCQLWNYIACIGEYRWQENSGFVTRGNLFDLRHQAEEVRRRLDWRDHAEVGDVLTGLREAIAYGGADARDTSIGLCNCDADGSGYTVRRVPVTNRLEIFGEQRSAISNHVPPVAAGAGTAGEGYAHDTVRR